MTSMDYEVELNYYEMVLIGKKMQFFKAKIFHFHKKYLFFEIFRVLKNIWKKIWNC